MEEASKYIRKAREVTHDCCSKVIEGQSALDHFFLVMEDKTDTKTSDKEKEEIELERGKMKGKMKSLQEAVQKFENTWLRGEQKITETEQKRIETEQLRTEKGRRDHLHKNDSGFISVGSSIFPQNSELSSIISQPTNDPDEKQQSDKFNISIPGPAALPGIQAITEEADDHKTDKSFSEIAASEVGACATSIIKETKYYTKHPLEHEEPNSIIDRDKETCNDTNDKLNLDKCDKLYPGSMEMVYKREAKENEKADHTERDLSETITDEPAQAQADVRTHAADTEQEPKVEVVRESANNLREDGTVLQAQGNHQKLRHKCSKNKSNSL